MGASKSFDRCTDQMTTFRSPPTLRRSAELSPRTFCIFRRELSSPTDHSQVGERPACLRGVERRQRTADDHPHDNYGPPSAALRPPASGSRPTHGGRDHRHGSRGPSLDGPWVARQGTESRGWPRREGPEGAGTPGRNLEAPATREEAHGTARLQGRVTGLGTDQVLPPRDRRAWHDPRAVRSCEGWGVDGSRGRPRVTVSWGLDQVFPQPRSSRVVVCPAFSCDTRPVHLFRVAFFTRFPNRRSPLGRRVIFATFVRNCCVFACLHETRCLSFGILLRDNHGVNVPTHRAST